MNFEAVIFYYFHNSIYHTSNLLILYASSENSSLRFYGFFSRKIVADVCLKVSWSRQAWIMSRFNTNGSSRRDEDPSKSD